MRAFQNTIIVRIALYYVDLHMRDHVLGDRRKHGTCLREIPRRPAEFFGKYADCLVQNLSGKLQLESIYRSEFEKTCRRPGVVESADENVGIERDAQRLSRAPALFPVRMDDIHHFAFRNTARCTMAMAFCQ